MALSDKILRFLITRIPIKPWKEELKKKIFIKFNFYGNNNKVYLERNGILNEVIYNIPNLGLWISGDNNIVIVKTLDDLSQITMDIEGDSNNIIIDKDYKSKNSLIDIHGNRNRLILRQNLSLENSNIDISGNYNYIDLKQSIKLKNSYIDVGGNNNKVKLSRSLYIINSLISMSYSKNFVYIKPTQQKIRDAKFYIEEGSKLYIGKDSELKNGGLHIVTNGNYGKKLRLIIGNNVHIAKDVIIRTSDGHSLIDSVTKKAINSPKDVIIGNNVWIASRCIILKGSKIPNNSMIGAMSLVNKSFSEENVMLYGIPAKIMKHNILWDTRGYGKYMKDLEDEKC